MTRTQRALHLLELTDADPDNYRHSEMNLGDRSYITVVWTTNGDSENLAVVDVSDFDYPHITMRKDGM